MGGLGADLQAHLASGVTTLCRCWSITRADGEIYGFTDHDCDLAFDSVTFRANTGLSAMALQQSTGLSVDNSEALGALSDAAIREDDIEAGRFDDAEVRAWLVNWSNTSSRWLQFRGNIGEIKRGAGAFRAELRGLTEKLNVPIGRVYQKPCTAVLGDASCTFDLTQPGYALDIEVERFSDAQQFDWNLIEGFEDGWFSRGRFSVLTGKAAGLWGAVKKDRKLGEARQVQLWQPLRGQILPGDMIRLEAGCDKLFETCQLKFNNLLNFQGFPDIPGEDWVMSVPRQSGVNTGGSRR